MPGPVPAVSLHGLTKYYGSSLGVEDITFQVQPGEIVGFLGPNGSGKTTVLRMLMGLISITRGSARVFGVDVAAGGPGVRERVGYLPGALSLYEHMTAGEYLGFLASMRRVDCSTQIKSLAARFGLDLDRKIDDMSKGNKQKVGVVQAFMHDPMLLVMDEPTSGLDPIVQHEFDDLLDEARERGASVLLSSHVLSEVERLSSHVAIIDKGRLVTFDHLDTLRERMTRRVTLEFAGAADVSAVSGVPGFVLESVDGRHITGTVTGSQSALLKAALMHDLVTVHSPEPSLDDLFVGIVNRNAHRAP